MTKPSIYFKIEFNNGCGLYRAMQPAKYLRKLGYKVFVNLHLDMKIAVSYDIIICQRPQENFTWVKLLELKKAGKKIVLEFDDDQINVPVTNPAHKFFKGKAPLIKHYFDISHACSVSTKPLKDLYGEWISFIDVLPNSIDFEMDVNQDIEVSVSAPRPNAAFNKEKQSYDIQHDGITYQQYLEKIKDKKVIVWGGSPTHFADLRLVSDQLIKILIERNDTIMIWCGSVEDKVAALAPHSKMAFFSGVTAIQYRSLLTKVKADIGLAPVINCQFNNCKCVTGDTLISTDKGLQRIDSLSTLKESDNWDLNSSGYVNLDKKTTPWSGFYSAGVQECIKITTKHGYSITGTKTHKIRMSNGEWKSLSDLSLYESVKLSPITNTVSSYVTVPIKVFVREGLYDREAKNTPFIVINEDWGRFLGYMIGDGYLGATGMSFSGSSIDLDVLTDVERLITSFGLHPVRVPKRDKRIQKEQKGIDIHFSGAGFRRFLMSLGVCGRKQKILRVPPIIFLSPLSVVREFLKGLFESDGTTSKQQKSVSLVSKDMDLIKDVQILLLMFGIKSYISKSKKKCQDWFFTREYYELRLAAKSALMFQDDIGFISERKRNTLSNSCQRKTSNAFNDWTWDDVITSIETNIQAETFDINVPNEHWYIGNGFHSHNSNLKTLEYGSLGIIPIASDLPTYQNTFIDKEEGFYVNNDDPNAWYQTINQVLDMTEEERKTIKEKVQKRIYEDFDQEKTIQKWVDFYDKVTQM